MVIHRSTCFYVKLKFSTKDDFLPDKKSGDDSADKGKISAIQLMKDMNDSAED